DMKSERNVLLMEVLLFFSRMGGSSSNRRSHSPTPTCVSMKSDGSMFRPINFTGGDSSTGQKDHCMPPLSELSILIHSARTHTHTHTLTLEQTHTRPHKSALTPVHHPAHTHTHTHTHTHAHAHAHT